MKMSKMKKALASESGAIMPFVVVLFLTMVVMAGMGVDFMRHEAARADLQNALDRGVLAATANTQILAQREGDMTLAEEEAAKKELIESYMRARTFAVSTPDVEVEVPNDLEEGETAVRADARYDLNTFFLKIAGFTQMGVPAQSYAEQRRVDIEIALVLDISGSMRHNSGVTDDEGVTLTKLDAMKTAVIDFVGTLITPETEDQTLVSVIPYSGHVSASQSMANHFGLRPPENFEYRHAYSWCFDFNTDGNGEGNSDFTTVSIQTPPTGAAYRQYQHVPDLAQNQSNNNYDGNRTYVCPAPGADLPQIVGGVPVAYSNPNVILPYSNNLTTISSMVENLEIEYFTATFNGVKWGAALLDPSSQPLMETLISADESEDVFDGWPNEYEEDGVQKYLIIMSDGRNTNQRKTVTDDDYYTATPDLTDEERRLEELAHYEAWNYSWPNQGWDASFPPAGLQTAHEGPQGVVGSDEGDTLTRNMCDAVKEAAGGGNLTVFTIGYELNEDPEDTQAAAARSVLSDCSTNEETDFFDIAGGADPAVAFNEITARIQLLKLAQQED